jgi:O-antigen ligase
MTASPSTPSAWPLAERIALAGALLCLLGMLLANAVMSVGFGLWVLGAVLHPDRAGLFARWRAKPALWGLSLLFLAYAAGGLYSADQQQWLAKLGVKLPFALLPIAVLALPRVERRHWRMLWGGLVLAVAASSVVVLVGFLTGWQQQTEAYTTGNAMATPINHIRYSLLVAFSTAAAGWLALGADSTRRARGLWLGLGLFLAVFLHVLAVRSGLLALYLILAYAFLRWMLVGRDWRRALPAMVLVVLAVVAAFRFVPTLQNRIRYARYDLERFAEGEVNPDLSDAKRIGSLHAGALLFREHPLLGVGTGDVPSAIQPVYAEHYPDLVENQPLPHNQWLFTGAALGLMGLLALSASLILPWTARGLPREGLFMAHQLALWSSMLTEATLETQYGATLYLVPLLLLWHQVNGSPQPRPRSNN